VYPHDDVLQGLFPDSIIPPEVRRYFSEAWELMEPSQRVEILAELREESDSIARISVLSRMTFGVLLPNQGAEAFFPKEGWPD